MFAFEEIKKMYPEMPINKNYCFVTLRGDVRAWINSDPKNNRVEDGLGMRFYGERQYTEIVDAILAMC